MRFNRPTQKIAAIRCPVCRNFFEVETAKLEEEAVVAIVVQEAPIMAVLIDDPDTDNSSSVSQPVLPSNATPSKAKPAKPAQVEIFDVSADEVEATQPASSGSIFDPAPPPPRTMKSVSGSRQSPTAKTGSSSASSLKKRIPLLAGAAASVAALIALAMLGYHFSSGKDSSRAAQLARGYQLCLEDLRDYMKTAGDKPEAAELDKRVEAFRQHLVRCVRMDQLPEVDVTDLRERLKLLYDLQQETKRAAGQLPAFASRGSKIDQLPSLIDLINKQHSYGVRQLPSSQNEAAAFCKDSLSSFRSLDQKLANALETSIESELPSITIHLDQLEKEYVRYTSKSDSRNEMSFEQKQIFECGEDFRRWCLSELQSRGQVATCQALQKEIEVSKSRLDQALRSHKLTELRLTALDRINNRANGVVDTGSALVKNEPTSQASESSGKKAPSDSSNEVASRNSTTPSSSRNSSGGSSPSSSSTTAEANPFEEQVTSKSSSKPNSAGNGNLASNSGKSDGRLDPKLNPFQDAPAGENSANKTGPSSSVSGTAGSTSSGSTSSGTAKGYDPGEIPNFPAAKYQGMTSLTLKVITKKTEQELKALGAKIASRFGGLADVQVRDNYATVSIFNYSGKIFDAIQFVDFGKVEICDSQSRTLFVVDLE